jgi:hypothetical protein
MLGGCALVKEGLTPFFLIFLISSNESMALPVSQEGRKRNNPILYMLCINRI